MRFILKMLLRRRRPRPEKRVAEISAGKRGRWRWTLRAANRPIVAVDGEIADIQGEALAVAPPRGYETPLDTVNAVIRVFGGKCDVGIDEGELAGGLFERPDGLIDAGDVRVYSASMWRHVLEYRRDANARAPGE